METVDCNIEPVALRRVRICAVASVVLLVIPLHAPYLWMLYRLKQRTIRIGLAWALGTGVIAFVAAAWLLTLTLGNGGGWNRLLAAYLAVVAAAQALLVFCAARAWAALRVEPAAETPSA